MLLQILVSRERQTLLESDGLLAVVNEKLLSSGQPISIPMFNTLFQVSNDFYYLFFSSTMFLTC